MKLLFAAFLAMAVSASAFPQEVELQERSVIIENQIRQVFGQMSQLIIDNGWDPWQINRLLIENEPQPGIIMRMMVEGLNVVGVSNIVPESVNYSVLLSRLRITVAVPEIAASLSNSALDINFHGQKYSGSLSGEFLLTRLVVTAEVRLNIGIIGGISIRDVVATLRLGSVRADGRLVVNGNDYSHELNDGINVRIPELMNKYQTEIDQLVSRAILEVGNAALGRNNNLQL